MLLLLNFICLPLYIRRYLVVKEKISIQKSKKNTARAKRIPSEIFSFRMTNVHRHYFLRIQSPYGSVANQQFSARGSHHYTVNSHSFELAIYVFLSLGVIGRSNLTVTLHQALIQIKKFASKKYQGLMQKIHSAKGFPPPKKLLGSKLAICKKSKIFAY